MFYVFHISNYPKRHASVWGCEHMYRPITTSDIVPKKCPRHVNADCNAFAPPFWIAMPRAMAQNTAPATTHFIAMILHSIGTCRRYVVHDAATKVKSNIKCLAVAWYKIPKNIVAMWSTRIPGWSGKIQHKFAQRPMERPMEAVASVAALGIAIHDNYVAISHMVKNKSTSRT